MSIRNKRKVGFANLSPKKLKEIASKGGKTAQARGSAHRWNSREARAARLKVKR